MDKFYDISIDNTYVVWNDFTIGVLRADRPLGTVLNECISRIKDDIKHHSGKTYICVRADHQKHLFSPLTILKYFEAAPEQIGLVYGNSYAVHDTYRLPVFRESFDKDLLSRANYIGGPIFYNLDLAQKVAHQDGTIFDSNMNLLLDYELIGRLTNISTGVHIPEFISEEIVKDTPEVSQQMLSDHINYLNQKYGKTQ